MPKRKVNYKYYEEQFYYHNTVIREEYKYKNPFDFENPETIIDPINPGELTNDWDSLMEITIFYDYLKKVNYEGNYQNQIGNLVKRLTLLLSKGQTEKISLNILRNKYCNISEDQD